MSRISVDPTLAPSHTRPDIQIRPFRSSDSEKVKDLYMSFLVEVKSILHHAKRNQFFKVKLDDSPIVLSMRSHKTAPLSLVSYTLGFAGGSLIFLANTASLRYLGLASMLIGIALFLYPLHSLQTAFNEYISKSLQGDMKDIARHYGLVQDGKSGESYFIGKSGFWVAEASGKGLAPEIVGCVGLDFNTRPDPNIAELRRVVVSAKYRRRGIAQQLLQAAVQHAKSSGIKTIFLTTSFYQVAAINMYKKLGFRVEKVREVSITFHKVSIYHFILDVVDYKM